MKVVLSRKYLPSQTLGRMIVFDGDKVRMQCCALELPDNGNQHNVSCIPEGKYKVSKIYSPTKGKCFLLKDVPNRTAIEIHSGNFYTQTEGCILVGNGFEDINDDGNVDVIGSKDTLAKLLTLLPDSFDIHII
jgi:hypothetical protein